MAQTLKHKRSSVVSNGSPKLPTTDQIAVGEIAINFAEGYETLSTRNNNNGIATFSSDSVLDKKYISSGAVVSAISAVTVTLENDEYTIAQAFNEQNDRITSLEEAGFLTDYTETDPTVPSWAKQSTKPTYTANEVGALPSTTHVPTEASIANSGFTKNALTAFTETDPTVPSWAKQSSKPTYTAAEVGAMATSERSNYLGTGTTYFDDAEYDSGTKRINFKKNNTVIDYIDATDFIKDGMVSSVTVSNGNLVISFNTDAGREDIELSLTQIFNPSNYYDKATADGKFLSAYTETDPTVVSFAKTTNGFYELGVMGGMPVDPEVEDTYGDKAFPTWHRVTYELRKYALSSHTHSNYSLSSHTHTAAEVGALPSTTDIPTQASIAGSGFTKNGNVQSDWLELDQTADSYILNSPVFSATGTFDKIYGIRSSIIDGGDGCIYFFPDADGLWVAGYNENDWTNKVLITGDVIKNAAIPGGDCEYSASTTQFGLIKIGNFLSGHNGFVSVATGTSNTTVARGDHSHSEYITSADTKLKIYTASGMTSSINGPMIGNALPQDFYTSVLSDVANGVLPVVRLSYTEGSDVLLPLQVNDISQEKLLFTAVYYNQTYTFTFDARRTAYCDYKTYWLQNRDTLRADILRSGFTQSAITAITINGSAATVSSGSASFNIELGGGGSGSGLPTVSATDNGKILQVVNGQWALVTPTVVYTGNGTPDNLLGNNGDIYLQTS